MNKEQEICSYYKAFEERLGVELSNWNERGFLC